jgi:hypothetical protein
MQHGHGTLECRLHLRIATGREGHFAQRTGLGISIVRLRDGVHGEGKEECQMGDADFHDPLLK